MSYPKQGEFCWNELMTPNPEQAKKFYCDLFGWKVKETTVGDIVYTLFCHEEKGMGGMLKTPDHLKEVPPHWLSYIAVDDLGATLEKATQLGAKIKVPATAAGDFGMFAIIEDPTGACFGLWKGSKVC